MAQWASEIRLSSLVSLFKNFSLINDNFQSDPISKLKTVRHGSDAVLHMSQIEFEFRPTQINLDRLN